MLLSKGSVKLRSLGLSPFVLALTVGAAGAMSTGCFFVDDGGGHHGDMPPDTSTPGDTGNQNPDNLTQVAIQPDQALSAGPGEGVGIFVEYRSDGKWHLWTTCDTFTSKAVCSFNIFATLPAAHLQYATDQVEGYDQVKDLGDGQVELIVDTDSDVDGLVLEADVGAPLTLEAYLDGNDAAPFVYWVSDNVIHTGAPDNPVQFVPAAP
jgi:hypothetical protein